MAIELDMVGIAVKDMAESLRFYRTLGLDIPEAPAGEDHVETTSGGMRIAWDTVELLKGLLGEWDEPKGNRMEIAFKCEDASGVDAVFARVTSAGFKGFREPWDAFWGQRYGILEDPDGNHVSLFA
ncbi:MAG TPA: VOC family protein [Chloroflexota bacterium]|nr:VOC family protein [Chloroflexota bacterium]